MSNDVILGRLIRLPQYTFDHFIPLRSTGQPFGVTIYLHTFHLHMYVHEYLKNIVIAKQFASGTRKCYHLYANIYLSVQQTYVDGLDLISALVKGVVLII